MGCESGISKNIISSCITSDAGGLEITAWVFNRADITPTYDATLKNKITSMALVATKQGYKITGVKKLFNAGHDIVVADDRPDKFTHYFNFQQFEFAAEDILNVDAINDVMIFVESKNESVDGDGVFIGLGVKKGLWKSTDTQRANDLLGARNLELVSMAGHEEPYSRYILLDTDYATTLALLEGLMTPPV